ncbi:MAG: hypothetical protein JW751_17010 [Polyangiaceae bacterium]|nr:hypothetical protein [Polyangiaceae bacterium]
MDARSSDALPLALGVKVPIHSVLVAIQQAQVDLDRLPPLAVSAEPGPAVREPPTDGPLRR